MEFLQNIWTIMQSWSWQTKSIFGMLMMTGITVTIPMMEKLGFKSETYFISWFLFCGLSFCFLAGASPEPIKSFFTPLWLFLVIGILALLIGGPANMLIVQAIGREAPNPALPFAIVGLSNVFAYVIAWIGGKIFPKIFPLLEFSPINFIGLALIVGGVVMVMYQKT